GQITASFYTARMLAATLAIRQEDQGDARKRSAMQFGMRWNDPAMYHVRDILREVLDHQGGHDQLITIIEAKRTNVVHVLNFLEEIATAIGHEMSDAGLLHAQFGGVVTRTWTKTYPWIQSHRTRRNSPKLWEHMEALYNDWKNPSWAPK